MVVQWLAMSPRCKKVTVLNPVWFCVGSFQVLQFFYGNLENGSHMLRVRTSQFILSPVSITLCILFLSKHQIIFLNKA